ncbi:MULTISPECIES: ATP-dependent DNA helicase [Oceanobacillus]|uniref:ATP-dependent helicase n=1 Tax=Oceanobacillus kimchii TaxID=746691 RepID=A0ABQ5TQ93_9BACI|nr:MULTISPECIES: ATP-dependent DNA helicase [Oceanobacillus]MBT2599579.1 ATP-dependent DNA helicase [Oceanobacillus sp. ISL-74]GLO67804.1 ATP-dependent helicase [Oceanobacillus kimchii]
MTGKKTLPFTISKNEKFFDRLGDYIGDVFYDILPEKGFELRDEQIFMAFQLEQAFKHKRTMFAEAGVGTGKTIVYLLYAICYARYMGKPVIISCADETLIEQLVKEGGDIDKLEQALDLEVDVRLAKARENYVCMKKLDPLVEKTNDEDILAVHDQIPDFVFDQGVSMQTFYRYGDRKEYPWVSDQQWERIGWDPLKQCATCDWRHRSAQTLNREYYRHAQDIIICSHDFYMEHVWTKESRKREGQLPLLPEASSVIFDEGHLLEFAAQKGLTYRFNFNNITSVLTGYTGQDVREESLQLAEDILSLHDEWFDVITSSAVRIEGSDRLEIPRSEPLLEMAQRLNGMVEELLEQLVFDAELFTIDAYHTKIIEEYLEFFSYGLSILLNDDEGIYWLEQDEMNSSLVIMPRLVENVLREEVFSQNIPFIFSSATLSQDNDFSYLQKSLGIGQYDSFSVDSPFDYESNREISFHSYQDSDERFKGIKEQLNDNQGHSLVLFRSEGDMNDFRQWAKKQSWEYAMLYEGDQEISEIVRRFQYDVPSILCAYHLWEGLDIPGKALSQVIIASLPYPPNDPVFKAKRKHAKNSSQEIDIPYMMLRMKQGVGRLIRTESDSGVVRIWQHATDTTVLDSLLNS